MHLDDPSETLDTDDDGLGNKADPDDDNDGLSDVTEVEIEAIRYSLILTAIP